MRSLRTFSFLATTFFRSSTESRLLTDSEKGPPVKGATVITILSADAAADDADADAFLEADVTKGVNG